MSRRADRRLDGLARDARRRFRERRAILFLEEDASFAAETFGGLAAARMMREMAEHLELNG